MPVLDGQVLLTTDRGGARGGLVRGVTQDDLRIAASGQRPYPGRHAGRIPGDDAIAVGVGLAHSSIASASASR